MYIFFYYYYYLADFVSIVCHLHLDQRERDGDRERPRGLVCYLRVPLTKLRPLTYRQRRFTGTPAPGGEGFPPKLSRSLISYKVNEEVNVPIGNDKNSFITTLTVWQIFKNELTSRFSRQNWASLTSTRLSLFMFLHCWGWGRWLDITEWRRKGIKRAELKIRYDSVHEARLVLNESYS